MLSRKALIKIKLENEVKEVFLMSEYEPKRNLMLKILDIQFNKSYTGLTSDLDLRTQAARIGLTFSDFIDHTILALFQESSDKCSFIYALHENDINFVFEWKSIDDEETIITLGSIKMVEQNYVSIFDNVLISLAKEILDLNSKVKSLTAELVECKSDTENALNQLSESVNIKENLEKELFSKFVLVLNEKKKKIRELKSGKLPLPCKNIKSKLKTSTVHPVSDSSEDEFPDLNKPGPSTAVKRSSLPFLDDDEEDSVVCVKSSKIRNRTVNKTKTFPKEIMPANVESTLSQLMDDDSDDLLDKM